MLSKKGLKSSDIEHVFDPTADDEYEIDPEEGLPVPKSKLYSDVATKNISKLNLTRGAICMPGIKSFAIYYHLEICVFFLSLSKAGF